MQDRRFKRNNAKRRKHVAKLSMKLRIGKCEVNAESRRKWRTLSARVARVARVENRLEEIDEHIEKLQDKARDTEESERKSLEQQIDQIQQQRDKVKEQLDELKSADVENWTQMQAEVQEALEKLEADAGAV